MANEFQLTYTGTASSVVGLLQNANGQFYNTANSAFEAYNASNVANYAPINFTQQGSTSEYLGSMPAGIAVGKYRSTVYTKASTTLATSDLVGSSWVGSAPIEWKGTGELSNAADLNVGVASNATALSGVVTSVGTLTTTVGTVSTAVSNVPSNVLSAVKSDSLLSKTWNTTLGKFSYNATTGALTPYQDDGVTSLGTVTITAASGTITSRA